MRAGRSVATATSGGGGGNAPYCALSRCSTASVAAMLSRPLGAAQSALLRGASLWAAECGMHVIWPCGGLRPREMRAEGRSKGDRRRRRSRKPNTLSLSTNKNACCCCVVLEAAIHRPQFQSARPPVSTTPYPTTPTTPALDTIDTLTRPTHIDCQSAL